MRANKASVAPSNIKKVKTVRLVLYKDMIITWADYLEILKSIQ